LKKKEASRKMFVIVKVKCTHTGLLTEDLKKIFVMSGKFGIMFEMKTAFL
jgi:hypothetical protein